MQPYVRCVWTVAVWVLLSPYPHPRECEGQAAPSRANTSILCPEKCVCTSSPPEFIVDCSGQNLTVVPKNLSRFTTHLDLGKNNLSKLPGNIFRKMESLRELRLANNNLKDLPRRLFISSRLLHILWLQGNKFTSVPARALQSLTELRELQLETNRITEVPADSFRKLRKLKSLWLDTNLLKSVPVAALSRVTSLEALNLDENNIKTIPANAFKNNSKLQILILAGNLIEEVDDNAFRGLSNLKILEFQRNKLKHVPVALRSLSALEELNMDDNRLEYLPDNSFSDNQRLKLLQLKGNPITDVAYHAFQNLSSLEKITISEARDMSDFPFLNRSRMLTKIRFDRASIRYIPDDLCQRLSMLKFIDVHSNRVSEIPDLSECSQLLSLNLGNNEITSLSGTPFRNLHELSDLVLVNNYITYIPENAFEGLSKLTYLDVSFNKISQIQENAFQPLESLTHLNVGENHISHLPTVGLEKLTNLMTYHNVELREFPPKETFPKIEMLTLSYSYHCCDFLESETDLKKLILTEHIVWMNEGQDPGFWDSHNMTPLVHTDNGSVDTAIGIDEPFDEDHVEEYVLSADASIPYLKDYRPEDNTVDFGVAKPPITCKPKPGPFMPCADLFGWWSLRCGVWFVFLLALLGNGVVLFVSITSRSKMDVPRFLICNLACADFFMGIYLGFLAIVDASTLGEFKKHAIWWQLSPGCVIAGFLGVLSSELSVFTLTIITLERFYAITHAMQLNKRLSLRHAGYIMTVGWGFSISIASLPIFGISDFRKFAVCLPFEIDGIVSKSYVCFIMIFNGISFFIILSCYFIMYLSIRDSQAWNSNDMRVAKRMALLVFTDFVCWAPIAFLSLAATFWKNLIHLNEAKVLTIFILPLNSCANPFLYAIFTKQFKKDCVLLCRRLEDSSIARHFSRVSNRHGSSWVSSRRPSGLNSLVPGEKRGSNSNSMSIGSQYAGLVNYNSDSNNLKNESDKNEYDPHKHRKSGHHHCNCRKGHKTKKANNKKNVENRKTKTVVGTEIVVHQEFCSKDKSEDMNCTEESYLTTDGDDDRLYQTAWAKQAGTVCTLSSCPCRTQSAKLKKSQITLPVVAFQGQQDQVSFISQPPKSHKKIPWTQSIPCCSTESSPIETDKHCDYDLATIMQEDSNGSSERCVQCCSTSSKPRPKAAKDSQLPQAQFDIQLVIEDNSPARRASQFHPELETDKQEETELNNAMLKKQSISSTEVNPDHASESHCVNKRRKREKIDKNVHLRFFTQSLAEHDFIQSSVCRSNSLVELTQPQLVELYHPQMKRLSLTPGQEGYLLLNGNGNRDSAFIDDEDEFDISQRLLKGYNTGNRKCESNSFKRRQTAADTAEDDEESAQLLFDTDKNRASEEADTFKSSGQNLSSLRSCDKESGFVSEL